MPATTHGQSGPPSPSVADARQQTLGDFERAAPAPSPGVDGARSGKTNGRGCLFFSSRAAGPRSRCGDRLDSRGIRCRSEPRALQICVIGGAFCGCAVKALSHERAHDAVAWEPRWPEPLSRDRTGPQRENATAILCDNQKVMLSANRELSSANRPGLAADPMACSARNAG